MGFNPMGYKQSLLPVFRLQFASAAALTLYGLVDSPEQRISWRIPVHPDGPKPQTVGEIEELRPQFSGRLTLSIGNKLAPDG